MARYIEIIMRAGNGEKVYRETIDKQFYETKEQQLLEQVPLFLAVAETVKKFMVEQK